MVGTAVYQVAPCRATSSQNVGALNRRHDDGAAGRQRGQYRGDQAVDVEQRHDADRDVVPVSP